MMILPDTTTENSQADKNHECCEAASPKTGKQGWPFRARLALFLAITLAVLGYTTFLLLPPARMSADQSLQISMSGFAPGSVTIPAGKPVSLELVNSESPFHDGGGLHNFAAPTLGIDVVIPPKSSKVVSLPALAPGTYQFYCDVCCGGKENPTMRGTLVVS
ncbi:MAG TPA: cupredoxin domain-containing protein [Chloroflexia bacterium]|nr:cupredoxin domain-containing protein [Chloroflexia bacterium]